MIRDFLLLSAVTACLLAASAEAGPVPGFVEEWPGTSTASWTGGAAYDNPGTGGFLGAGDGYLRMNTYTSGNLFLGAFSSATAYAGDWVAADIRRVSAQLNDVNADEALEIHFAIGRAPSNVWQFDLGFLPPDHAWAEYVVDLADSTAWTQILGTGSFAAALRNADRILLRHDLSPYEQFPDTLRADVGVDHLQLHGPMLGVGASPKPGPVVLSPPFPNPSRGPVAFEIFSAAEGVRVEIVDALGRRVRSHGLAPAAGPRLWMWDGRDAGGAPVPPGVYRVRAIGPRGGASRSLIRIR